MTHLQIALSIWAAIAVVVVLVVISALGLLFGYKNIIGALLGTIVIYGGGFGLVIYTIWAILSGK